MILQVSFRELTYPTIGIFNFGAVERATLDQIWFFWSVWLTSRVSLWCFCWTLFSFPVDSTCTNFHLICRAICHVCLSPLKFFLSIESLSTQFKVLVMFSCFKNQYSLTLSRRFEIHKRISLSHRTHVCYIYTYFCRRNQKNVGKNTSPMDGMGFDSFWISPQRHFPACLSFPSLSSSFLLSSSDGFG